MAPMGGLSRGDGGATELGRPLAFKAGDRAAAAAGESESAETFGSFDGLPSGVRGTAASALFRLVDFGGIRL